MAFTAKDVQQLRERTGVGMMDCKKALTQTDGDMEKAIDILREKGLAAAANPAVSRRKVWFTRSRIPRKKWAS